MAENLEWSSLRRNFAVVKSPSTPSTNTPNQHNRNNSKLLSYKGHQKGNALQSKSTAFSTESEKFSREKKIQKPC